MSSVRATLRLLLHDPVRVHDHGARHPAEPSCAPCLACRSCPSSVVLLIMLRISPTLSKLSEAMVTFRASHVHPRARRVTKQVRDATCPSLGSSSTIPLAHHHIPSPAMQSSRGPSPLETLIYSVLPGLSKLPGRVRQERVDELVEFCDDILATYISLVWSKS